MRYSVLGVLLYDSNTSAYEWYFPHIDRCVPWLADVNMNRLVSDARSAYSKVADETSHARRVTVRYGLNLARRYLMYRQRTVDCIVDYVIFEWSQE